MTVKKIFNSIGDREWNELCICQLKPETLTEFSFLVRTSSLFYKITQIVSDLL